MFQHGCPTERTHKPLYTSLRWRPSCDRRRKRWFGIYDQKTHTYMNNGASVLKQPKRNMCIKWINEDLILEDVIKIGSCSEYTFLGSTINKNGCTENETEERILKRTKITDALNSILWSKTIFIEKKMQLYSIFTSMVLYGCECWQINKRPKQKLLTLEMNFVRRSTTICCWI